MHTFIVGVRQRWVAICQLNSVWGCLVVVGCAVTLLRQPLPLINGATSDIYIRLFGMILQLVGAWTVLKDLTNTAGAFGEEPTLGKLGDCLKAIVFGVPPVAGSAIINLAGATCTANGSTSTIHQGISSNEIRLDRLERAVKSLQGEVEKVSATVETNKQELVRDLKGRTYELRRAITELKEQLKSSLVGSFSMLSFGVFSLAVGIVLTSIPLELASLFRLGLLPRLG